MKIQDILFLLVFVAGCVSKRFTFFPWLGILCLAGAMPLFSTWTFFTAERLTWYGAGFFLGFILISLFWRHKVQ